MGFTFEWKGLIRALIYPVQFEINPTDGVDRVLANVIDAGVLDASPNEYLEAIRMALTSDVDLSALIPQDHSETAIRAYLAEIERRLEPRLQAKS